MSNDLLLNEFQTKLEEAWRQLDILLTITELVGQKPELESIEDVMSLLAKKLDAEKGIIFLKDLKGRKPDEMMAKFVYGLNPDLIGKLTSSVGIGIIGQITKDGLFIMQNDGNVLTKDSLLSQLKIKIQSFLGVPIRLGEEVEGVLCILNKDSKNGFIESDERISSCVAIGLTPIIRRFQLLEIQRDYSELIRVFGRAIEAKDMYTRDHSMKVSLYAELTAKEFNLSKKEIEMLKVAGFLHDIGKVEIPEEILTKPNSLTDEEYEKVKKHPIASCNILNPIDVFKEIIPLIRGHHERMDGKGYPDKCNADELPLPVRILTVVDAYDAMTSDRAYRKRKDPEDAIEELQRKSRSQFDPEVVEKFLEARRKNPDKIR